MRTGLQRAYAETAVSFVWPPTFFPYSGAMDQKKSVQEKMMEIIAQANVGSLACSYMKSYSLNAVIELGIADIIHSHGQPLTASQLVAKIPTSSSGDVPRLDRLMGFLVHAGVFAEVRRLTSEGSSEISYGMTPVSRLLLRDGPQSLLSSLRLMLHPLVVSSWENLPNCFRSGEGYPTAFEGKHGAPLWTKASLDPAFNKLFNEAMSCSSKQLLVRMFDGCGQVFEGVNSLVDVGGGNGTVAAFLAYAFPNIKCMVLDLPHVVASSSPQPNVVAIAGDMFESIPPADVILLKEVLHHWDDEKCVKILKRCRESIPKPGGKVIIVDMVRTKWLHPTIDEMQLMLDLHIMVMFNGKERNEDEWKRLFVGAGFSSYKIVKTERGLSLIEVFP